MKTRNLMTAAGCALACALVLPAGLAASGAEGEACRTLSLEIVKYANTNNIGKIVMGGFAPGGGAEAAEAEYVSQRTTAYLSGHKTPALIERSFFESVLLEARASSAANTSPARVQRFKELLSVDAVVSGTVLAAGGKLMILARLIDINTGKVLFAAEAESGREWLNPSEIRTARRGGGVYSLTAELPGILVPDSPSAWDAAPLLATPSDLRDAVADPRTNPATEEDGSCAARKRRLSRLNSELVDAKAGYWAAKMKTPGFGSQGLRKNPGSEIEDPAVKARFYKLLAGYYKAGPAAPTGPGKLALVERLLEDEELFSGDCELP